VVKRWKRKPPKWEEGVRIDNRERILTCHWDLFRDKPCDPELLLTIIGLHIVLWE